MSKLLFFILATGFLSVANADDSGAVNSDPTKPLGYAGSGSGTADGNGGIQLMSILIGDQRRMAIINGQTLHENQEVKGVGAIVKKIETDAVTLQQGNKVWRVSLNSTVIRK